MGLWDFLTGRNDDFESLVNQIRGWDSPWLSEADCVRVLNAAEKLMTLSARGRVSVEHLPRVFDLLNTDREGVIFHGNRMIDPVSTAVASVAAEIGSPAVPYLTSLLLHPNGSIVTATQFALTEIGAPAAPEVCRFVEAHGRAATRNERQQLAIENGVFVLMQVGPPAQSSLFYLLSLDGVSHDTANILYRWAHSHPHTEGREFAEFVLRNGPR